MDSPDAIASMTSWKSPSWYVATPMYLLSGKIKQFGMMVAVFSHIAILTRVPLARTDRMAWSRPACTPAASNATFTPEPSHSSRTLAIMSSLVGSSTQWAPNCFAYSRRRDATSETMIFLAPLATSVWSTASPIGPPPRIRTESPFLKGLVFTACHATANGSTRANFKSQRIISWD